MNKNIPSFKFILSSKLKNKSFVYEFYFKNKKTLDLGCGEGEFMKHGKDNIIGVDSNTRVIENLSIQGYKVVVADARKLPFEDGVFEAVHCHNVIEHMDVQTAYLMLKEAGRVLLKGGVFVISSEVVTKKFWNTFGHIKPYSPEAIVKLMRSNSRESFEGRQEFEFLGVFYSGDYFKNKLFYLVSFTIGYFTPLLRREYFLILKKK